MPKEETYNPLKLPGKETYEPFDKDAYLNSLTTVKPKVSSFRQTSLGDSARMRKFIAEEDKIFQDNPLYDGKSGNS